MSGAMRPILTWLAEHDGLTERQAMQLRSLAGRAGFQARVGAALWRHAGDEVLPFLREAPRRDRQGA
ncbi:hypothetical protein [Actinomadura sp. HBU206391]|uniref:hypothetical protein n=1 Tax=Actinomadura sp. HBU206391 TaxID=2731692 RepID=UPI00164FA4CF|nr:hypothetical protein [Actinomadura sp. HBU206391]MBC6459523.1 hypothetical protein [Actinomadura sp. HBU206391]